MRKRNACASFFLSAFISHSFICHFSNSLHSHSHHPIRLLVRSFSVAFSIVLVSFFSVAVLQDFVFERVERKISIISIKSNSFAQALNECSFATDVAFAAVAVVAVVVTPADIVQLLRRLCFYFYFCSMFYVRFYSLSLLFIWHVQWVFFRFGFFIAF